MSHSLAAWASLALWWTILAQAQPPATPKKGSRNLFCGPVYGRHEPHGAEKGPGIPFSVVVARAGLGVATIVIPDQMIPAEQTAARELAHYLKAMTGAAFRVVSEDSYTGSGPAIYVGPTRFAGRHGIDVDRLGDEELVVRTCPQAVVLAGGRPRGTLYAVYTFLEDVLGVRWWTLLEEEIPRRPDLVVPPVDRRDAPAFAVRWHRCFRYFGDRWRFVARHKINSPTFKRRADLPIEYGGHFRLIALGHATTRHLIRPDTYFAHPDWFAAKGGKYKTPDELKRMKPTQWELCFSKRAMRRELARVVLKRIRERKAQEARDPTQVRTQAVYVQQMDNRVVCDCARCRGINTREGTDGGAFWECMNELAGAIAREFPGMRLMTIAYKWSRKPPRHLAIRDNVIVEFAPVAQSQCLPLIAPEQKAIYDDLAAWTRKTNNVFVFYYCSPFGPWQGLPLPTVFNFRDDLRRFRRLGVRGVALHVTGWLDFDQPDVNVWMGSKLLWDPDQDFDRLWRTFTDGFYGPAGVHIRAYFAALEAAARKPAYVGITWKTRLWKYGYLTSQFVSTAHRLYDQAERAVRDDPLRLARVRRSRLALDRATLVLWPEIGPGLTGVRRQDVLARFSHTWEGVLRPIGSARWRRHRDTIRNDETVTVNGFVKWWNTHALRRWWMIVKHRTRFERLPPELHTHRVSETVSVFPEQVIGHSRTKNVVPDAPSPGGVAVVIHTDKLPLTAGLYTDQGLKTLATIELHADAIKGPGYHAYRLGRVTPPVDPATSGVRVGKGWDVTFYGPNIVATGADFGKPWEVYVSLRFAGPAFVPSDAKSANAVYVDRLILVPK